jgi:fructose-bisphosphate aldolase class II
MAWEKNFYRRATAMSLKNNNELLEHAAAHGYAVGAFNVNNLEQIRGVIETAVEEKAPVIVAVNEGAIKHGGWPLFCEALPKMAVEVPVPVSVHLDHGSTFENVVKSIVGGFTSVMYDCSKLSFEENVAEMRRVVAVARSVGVSVEGEIGYVGGKEAGAADSGDEKILTDPDEAARFTEASMVDSLAVAVGTVHGMRKQTAKIDLERVSAIAAVVKVPLVLHGASGVPDDVFEEIIRRGIRKINIGTELQKSFTAGVRGFLAGNPDAIDVRKVLKPGIDNMKEAVRMKIRLFKSSGKAW